MAATKSRLGRGLGALIASGAPASAAKETKAETAAKPPVSAQASAGPASAAVAIVAGLPGFQEISVAQIEPSAHQARRDFNPEHITELAESIRAEGLLQPIVVRKVGEKFQLIAGERRWRAFQQLRIKNIPARIVTANDAASAALGLIENLQREGLNPIEEANGYASLIRDFSMTQEVAAERVGRARASVANALRLLTLDKEIQGYIAKEMLTVGHAKVLLGVEDVPQRAVLARRVIEQGLSVRATEKLVGQHKRNEVTPGKPGRAVPGSEAAAISSIEKKLTTHFGARVAVQHTPKRGKIVIEYAGNDDLQRILETIGVEA